jgi:hypothetical protein
MIFNWLMMVVTFLLTVLHCLPIQSNWNAAAYPNAKCLNFADFVTGTACVAILTDVLVLILPTWIVYNLQIQKKQKIMVIGILSFGLVYVYSFFSIGLSCQTARCTSHMAPQHKG